MTGAAAPGTIADMLFALVAVLSGPVLAAAPLARPEDALPKAARVLKALDADLDGDGRPERILAAGLPDPDRDAEHDARGSAGFEGSIEVHVLTPSGKGWADAGKIDMEGFLEEVLVEELGEGTDRVRLLFAAAAHCGASCAAIELHAYALRGGRLVAYLAEEMLWKGSATVYPGRFLETWTREDEEAEIVECCPDAFRVRRLAPKGGKLVELESAHVLAEERGEPAAGGRERSAARLALGKGAPGPILSPARLAARDWLVRPGVSIGKIRLGMSSAGVHDRLGPPADRRESGGGLAVERWGDRSRVLVWLDDDKVVQIAATSPRFKTGDGLGPGEPVAKVLAKFPDDARAPESSITLIQTFRGIAFQVAKGDPTRVQAVIVHDAEENARPLP